MFIGIWAFVLALVWVYAIDKRSGEKVPLGDIWRRFPKFVIGYFITFAAVLGLAWACPAKVGDLKAPPAKATSSARCSSS